MSLPISPHLPHTPQSTPSPTFRPPVIGSGRRAWVTANCRCWLANPIGIVLPDVTSLVPGLSPLRVIRARWKRGAVNTGIGGGVVRLCITEGEIDVHGTESEGQIPGWVIPVGDNWRLIREGDELSHAIDDDTVLDQPEVGMRVVIVRSPRFIVVRSRVHKLRGDIDDIRTLDELIERITHG